MLEAQGIEWRDDISLQQAKSQGYWDITMPDGNRLLIKYEPDGLFKPSSPSTWAKEYAWWNWNGFVPSVAQNVADQKVPYTQVLEAAHEFSGA